MNVTRMLTTLAVALPLALAGCGDDSDSGGGGGQDGKALYSGAVNKLDTLKSGKLDANLVTVLRANDQKLTVSEKAAFAEAGGTKLPQFDIDIHVEDPNGKPQDTSAINDGKDFYVKQQGASEFEAQGAQALDAVTSTYKREQTALGSGRVPLLSLTPGDWAKSPKVDGTETVGGDELKKITADLDVPKFLKDLETGKESDVGLGVTLTQDARKLLEPGADVKTATLVALVDDDGRLRRLTAKVDGNVGGGVNVDFDLQMSELDAPQEIAAP
ncbi:MAG TPA: hypothetical protein VF549_11375 [Solirubrobacteraceae bacterium]|jgi:hypothetical protein